MKYVYAVLTVVENQPIMQTYQSDVRMTGRDLLDKVILTDEERRRYADWKNEIDILKDLNDRQSMRVEIQEVEVR